jgi:hypothetical protein
MYSNSAAVSRIFLISFAAVSRLAFIHAVESAGRFHLPGEKIRHVSAGFCINFSVNFFQQNIIS